MGERKWVVKDIMQNGTNYIKAKTALNNLKSCTAIDNEEYFFMCQNSALGLVQEKLSETNLYTIIKQAFTDVDGRGHIDNILEENEKSVVVFIDKKANKLYSRSDNIIAVNEDFKSCTFFNNKHVNDNLLEKNYDESKDFESNKKRIKKILETSSVEYPVRSLNLEHVNELTIFSNYYQLLLSYNFFNLQEFDKEYHKAIASNSFANYIHTHVYKENTNPRFAFLLKKTRKWF